jgi:methylmalonyl-CoA mutase N-terminal domain/subunit
VREDLLGAQGDAGRALEELRDACRGDANLMWPLRAALADACTVGEVCGVMREEFGEYREV